MTEKYDHKKMGSLATFQTKIISTCSVEQNATFKTAGLQWLFSNKRTPQLFLESTADCLL